MDSELDREGWWDRVSCQEFEDFLDEMNDEAAEEAYEERRIAALEAEWKAQHNAMGDF